MNYSDYFITTEEFDHYVKSKSSEKLDQIWHDMLNRIGEPTLKTEASKKGYIVEDNPDMENDIVADYMKITVPGASQELQEYIEERLYPFVVCMKE